MSAHTSWARGAYVAECSRLDTQCAAQSEGSPKRPGTRQPGRSGIPPPLSVESDGGDEPSRRGLASWFMRGR